MGDLTEPEAISFLRQLTCDLDDAKAANQLINGHLPYLLEQVVCSFCLRQLSIGALHTHFTQQVRSSFEHVGKALGCNHGCACAAACAVRDKEWGHTGLEHAESLLLKKHVVRVILKERIRMIDSHFVLCYLARECNCNNTDYVAKPPCG